MPRAWPMDHIPGLANGPHSDRMPPETLRIAFATPQFVTERHFDGGLANYLNRVSCMLADAGHDVHVVTLSSEGEADLDHAGVRVHRVMLGSDWQWVNWLTRYRLSTTCYWLNLSSRMYRKLRSCTIVIRFTSFSIPTTRSAACFSYRCCAPRMSSERPRTSRPGMMLQG
jgi:hypothetical protein